MFRDGKGSHIVAPALLHLNIIYYISRGSFKTVTTDHGLQEDLGKTSIFTSLLYMYNRSNLLSGKKVLLSYLSIQKRQHIA